MFSRMLSMSMANYTAAVSIFVTVISAMLLTVIPQPILLVAIPLIIPIALLAFRLPVWICLGFIVFSFFRIHEAIPALLPFRIPQLLALASITVLAWHLFISKSAHIYWTPQLSLFTGFFIFICFGALMATDRASAITILKDSFAKVTIMVFAIAWLIRQPKHFQLTSHMIIIAGVTIAIIAISNKLNGIGLVEGTRVTIGRNIGSMIGDPNDLALVLTFPLSFSASQFFCSQNSTLRRCVMFLAYCCIAWAIVCTQSRGGLLGMAAVTGALLWRSVKNKILVVGAAVVLMAVLVSAAGISDRASGGSAESGIDESAMGRIYAWQAAINMAIARPITGVGINNFYANYYFYSPHWDGKNHAVHSTWFQMLAEAGFIGLSLFVTLVGATFAIVFRCLRRIEATSKYPTSVRIMANSLYSGLVGFCVSGTFLTQGFIWPFYILFALSIALNQYVNALFTTAIAETH